MKKLCSQLFAILVLLATTTIITLNIFASLDMTVITLIYLLVVITAAYFFEFTVAISTALLAFLAINYFFTVPRYTFEVASVESLASLICFLIVSFVVTSLVKQLRLQTLQSEIATKHANFARELAEKLALATDASELLQSTCQLLQTEFDKPFAIVIQSNGEYMVRTQSSTIELPSKHLLQWVTANGKPISPYTDYWSQCEYWLIPFNRVPNQNPHIDPILMVGNIDNENSNSNTIETYTNIKSSVDQISLAYQRLINIEQLKNIELNTKSEAIQNAMLASISHDMRTPLTAILGAATTLQQTNTSSAQSTQLAALIASQAQYLSNTTENILSLIRLESSNLQATPMDWQSPEELIGVVCALYKNRNEPLQLEINISEPELLIRANASLITQALVNLIDNSKQAQLNAASLNPSSVQQQEPIIINVTKAENRINISVLDRGVGFSEAFTVSDIKKFSSGNPKGFGLGLSIVKAVARVHHADFIIQNRVDGGASATLSFFAEDLGHFNAE